MSRLHKVDPSTITENDEFKVTSRLKSDGSIVRLVRKSDQVIFNVGDFVTNGTKMRGHIKSFDLHLSEDSGKLKMYVSHTWSGVGMNLASLSHTKEEEQTNKLPSRYQIDDLCAIKFSKIMVKNAKVIAVHFTKAKVKYDLEVSVSTDDTLTTRIYNVDSAICEDN